MDLDDRPFSGPESGGLLNLGPLLSDRAVMGSPVKWTERFNFSDEHQATSEVLFAALAQGRISEAEYISWAQDAYQLPFVTAEFFAIPPDRQFWDRVKDVHPWTPNLFPLADWSGVLLIACVEPPAHLDLKSPHRFLLATARNLQMQWQALNPEPIRQVPSPAPQVEQVLQDRGTLIGEAIPDLGAELPDGVLPNYALDGIAEGAPAPEIPAPPIFDPVMDMPDGIGIGGQNLGQQLPPLSTMPDGFAHLTPPPVVHVHRTSPPPPPPAELIENRDFVSEPSITMTMTNSPDPAWIIPTDPVSLDRCMNLDELNLHTLSTVCRHFTGGIIMMKDAHGAMKPGRFTQPFRTPRKEFGAIKFDEPSIFRIVNRTLLPYHGYVTPAPENDRFFKAFLGGMAPTHITIVPVLANKEMVGMIVGIADSEKSFRHILPIMEALAGQYAKAYQRLGPQAVAA